MRRLAFIGLAVLSLGLVPARPAHAQEGFFRWLEKLSGPGHFMGAGGELYFLCVGHPKSQAKDANSTASADVTTFVNVNCGKSATDRSRLKVGSHYSITFGNNNLTPQRDDDKVTAQTVMGTADFGWLPFLELGSAVGLVRFGNEIDGSSSMKPIWEVLRVTIMPLSVKATGDGARDYRLDALQFRLTATLFTDLDSTDFGAPAGTYHKDKEWRLGIYAIVNFDNAFR